MNPMASKSRLLLETLLIIAGCEGVVMLLMPLVLTGADFWLAAGADTTLLVFTTGPLLYWRFSRYHRSQDAQRRAELEQRTLELLKTNATLKHEVGERERAQSFLNSVVENLPIPVFIKEAKELRFVLWNKAGEKLSGIPNAEMIGRNDFDFFPVQDAERNVAKDRAAFEGKGVLEIPEEIMQTRDHGARIVRVWKVPIFDAAGQPAFLLGIAEDITDRKQAEMALAQSTSLLNAALESTADGLLVVDNHGRVSTFNQKFLELWQVPPALAARREDKELLQHVLNQLAEPAVFLAKVEDLYHTPQASSLDELRFRDGRVFERYSQPQRLGDSVVGRVWNFRDITQRKQATEALHQSEERFRLLVEESPDVIGIYQENRLVFMNSIGVRLLGAQTQAELLNRKSEQLIHPDDLADAGDRIRRRLAGETGLYPAEVRYLRVDGTPIPMEVSAAPITYDGQPAVQFIARDITERKRAEAALAEASNLMETLLENSPDLIYFKDRESRFLRYSKGFLSRFGLADFGSLHHKTDFDIFDEAHARPAYEDEQEIIRTGQPIIGKAEQEVWLDGRVTWALTSKLPWRDAQDRIIGTFGISKDITALKEAEAKLEQTHRQLLETSRLAGMAEVATNVLHNVGNVLNSVNISAAVVVDTVRKSKICSLARIVGLFQEHAPDLGGFVTSDPKGKQLPAYLAQLSEHLLADQKATLQELDSLSRNVEHIKEIVAMQQNYATVGGVKEMTDVVSLVEVSLRLNMGALSRHRVEVIREFETVPPLNIEKHKLLQILVNLVRNAKHACQDSDRADRRLTVRVANRGGSIEISVADNGVGIPPENQTRIFSHGFTTRKTGHGFGLHSGALAARELGGSLTVHSDGPNQGAVFTLELPGPTPEQADGHPGQAARSAQAKPTETRS